MHQTLKFVALPSSQFQRRRETLLIRFELPVGQPYRINFKRIAAKVVDLPANIPSIRRCIAR